MSNKVLIDKNHLEFLYNESMGYAELSCYDYEHDSSLETSIEHCKALLGARKALGIKILTDYEKKQQLIKGKK